MSWWRKNKTFKTGEPIIRRVPFAGAISGDRHPRGWRKKARLAAKIVGLLASVGIVLGFFGVILVFAWVSRDLPDPNRLVERQVQRSTKIWDRTGTHLLYEIHGDQNRTVVKLQDIAPLAVQAAIASEDKDFYQHGGVQIKSFFRAIIDYVLRRQRLQATSTITQQVVKNVILSSERTITRKVKEVILAYQIDRKFSKDEILQIYFNEIPYGSTSYGIESAAQAFFGKSSRDLTAPEGALLAAMVRAPSRLSPYGSHTDELVWWEQHILDVMRDMGSLSDADWAAAKKVNALALVKPKREAITAPHFSLYVKELLADQYGEAEVEGGGLNVITTLDYDKQKLAEEAVKNGLPVIKQYDGSNAALVSIDPKTGQVLAMVGSVDYFDTKIDGNVNVALRPRQPGSSFKPIVYAAAFEKGYTPNTVVFDVNTSFPTDDPEKPYEPKDYDLGERGPITLKKALGGSLNVPAVKTLYLTGIDRALEFAKTLGYTTLGERSRFGLSLVLGGAEVKLVEHVAAYATFATEGTWRQPAYILKVTDAAGETLQEWQDAPKENLMSVETARNITDILSDNANRAYIFGENNRLVLPDRPAAAKTGTTNNFVDAWIVGYTPSLVTGVWTGNNDGNAVMKKGADGSKLAAPIWQEFMTKALADVPPEPFTPPQPIVTGKPVLDGQAGTVVLKVDKYSGKLATEATPPSAIEERTYRQAHDILNYVEKDDPRGPMPPNPAADPQYEAWEAGVRDWAARNGWTETEPPPTETDASVTGSRPTVTFADPEGNAVIAERSFHVRVAPTSSDRPIKRVEFYLEGVPLGSAAGFPWETYLNVPSTFEPGFYELKAVAFDEVGNWGSTSITINSQVASVPIQVKWLRPSYDITVPADRFPLYLDTQISERLGVARVNLVASATDGSQVQLGALKNPTTNGVSVAWDTPPNPGLYTLRAIVQLVTGATQSFEGPSVMVK